MSGTPVRSPPPQFRHRVRRSGARAADSLPLGRSVVGRPRSGGSVECRELVRDRAARRRVRCRAVDRRAGRGRMRMCRLRCCGELSGWVLRLNARGSMRAGSPITELRINGQRVGDAVLDPGFTDYDEHRAVRHARRHRAAADRGQRARRGTRSRLLRDVHSERLALAPGTVDRRAAAARSAGIEHSDGTVTEMVTDDSWRVTERPDPARIRLYCRRDVRRTTAPCRAGTQPASTTRPGSMASSYRRRGARSARRSTSRSG